MKAFSFLFALLSVLSLTDAALTPCRRTKCFNQVAVKSRGGPDRAGRIACKES